MSRIVADCVVWLIKECFNVFEWAITSVSGGNHRHFYYASKALNLEVSSLTLPHLQSEQSSLWTSLVTSEADASSGQISTHKNLSVCSLQSLRKMEQIWNKYETKWECQSNLSAIVEPRKGAGSANQADLRSKILRKENQTPMRLAAYSVTVTHLTKMQIAQICVAFCQSFAVTIWLGICFTSVDIPRKRIFTYSEYSWRPVLTPRFGNGLGHRLGMTKASSDAVPTRFRHRSTVTRSAVTVRGLDPEESESASTKCQCSFWKRNEHLKLDLSWFIHHLKKINANHLALNLQDMDSPTVRTCWTQKTSPHLQDSRVDALPTWLSRLGQGVNKAQRSCHGTSEHLAAPSQPKQYLWYRQQLPNFTRRLWSSMGLFSKKMKESTESTWLEQMRLQQEQSTWRSSLLYRKVCPHTIRHREQKIVQNISSLFSDMMA